MKLEFVWKEENLIVVLEQLDDGSLVCTAGEGKDVCTLNSEKRAIEFIRPVGVRYTSGERSASVTMCTIIPLDKFDEVAALMK